MVANEQLLLFWIDAFLNKIVDNIHITKDYRHVLVDAPSGKEKKVSALMWF